MEEHFYALTVILEKNIEESEIDIDSIIEKIQKIDGVGDVVTHITDLKFYNHNPHLRERLISRLIEVIPEPSS